MIIADCEPMGAVRMTQRGKWKDKRAMAYLNYKRLIGWQIRQQWSEPIETPCKVNVTFHMPIPQSWSQKKKCESLGMPHVKKPDIDNIVKGLFDAANGIIWKDDNQVCELTCRKIYSDQPRIEIEVTEL